MGLFKRNKPPSQLSVRRLANTLHDAGHTDQQIADAIGASRSQVCKIRRGQETGTILRPRLLALVEGRTPGVVADEHQPKAPARPPRLIRQHRRSAPTVPAMSAARDLAPRFDTMISEDVSRQVSIDGRQFGWVEPDGRRMKQPPVPVYRDNVSYVPARMPKHGASRNAREDNRALFKRGYNALRDAGLSDTQAQNILAPFRELARWQRAAPSAEPREPEFVPFLAQAEHELRTGNNAGLWTTADVVARAKALARQDMLRHQTPRLPDPAPRLLAAPAKDAAPATAYRDTQLAWPRQPARLSLGDSLAAMREDTIRQVSDRVTALLRHSTQQAPGPAEAPTNQTPPALGMPATLGAPVGLPGYRAR